VPQQQVVQQQPVQQVSYVPPVQSKPLSFGETTVLGGEMGETTVLGGGMPTVQTDPHLLRSKNNEKIPLNKPVFRIGKERSYVDYFVSDNTAISRSHANIENQNGEFYVEDTNSTNHTYVNGSMIPSGQKVKLTHGDKVRLANEDFEFKLY
jgi:pSer/pThr/pTyr-binding forkhead associated (FHA) protein